jgi:hypothetical protein
MLLGVQLVKGVKICKVGAISNARWMAKLLCLLKAALLANQFPMEAAEAESVFRLVEFVICIYCYQWFNCKKAKGGFHDQRENV